MYTYDIGTMYAELVAWNLDRQIEQQNEDPSMHAHRKMENGNKKFPLLLRSGVYVVYVSCLRVRCYE